MRDDAPAALPLIAFACGLALAPSLVHAAACAAGLAVVAILLRRRRPTLALLFAALGIVTSLHAHRERATPRIDPDRFTIIEAPIDRDWSHRGDAFVLRTESFTANGAPFAMPLAIYARFTPPPIAMYATVRVEAFLRTNERGEYVATVKSSQLLAYSGRSHSLNRAIANRLRPLAVQHPAEVALIEALVLGRGEHLSDDARDGFKRGGTYHLLVFSGLQIAFAAGLLAWLLRWMHAPRVADWSLLAFAIGAPLFIGPTASVSRASGGIALYAISRILKRPTTFENLWCVSALLRLLIAPADLTDAAFHLTYAGAGALLFGGKWLGGRRTRWLACAVAAELAITPLTLYHFHQFALGGSLATLALTPLVFAMLVVGVAVCVVPHPALLAPITALNAICTYANDIAAHASGVSAAPSTIAMVIGFGAAMLAIAFLRARLRAVAILLAVAVPLVASIKRQHVDDPVVTMLDVGQGDAILVRDGEHAMLVDGGPPDARTLELLADRGVHRLDVVVLTHPHPDHYGGLPRILERMPVGELWFSPRRLRAETAAKLLAAGVPVRFARNGTSVLGHLLVTTFVPSRTFKRAPENNASVVVRVRVGRRNILLTGDAEREEENELHVPADVLKVAHHGSRSSSTDAFLDVTRPRIALISCGRRNLFGHPHGEVLRALARRGVRVLRTDRNGSIDVILRGDHIVITREIDTP